MAVSYGWDSVVACFCRPKSLAKSGIKEGKNMDLRMNLNS
jgi:hypothetical protein